VTFVLRAKTNPREDHPVDTKVTGYAEHPWHISGAASGGMKNSGLGREESLEEIESCTQHKNVYLSY
jgi:acyl-CoA reductase-like NAD-dependent aldehyde dehydrogenase